MVHDSPWMAADEELRSKNEEAEEEHSAVGEAEEDEWHDRDAEEGEEAGSMCQDELQRVHNIDDTDDLVGQEHTDDDEEEEDYGIHYRLEECSEGLAADNVPGLAEDVPLSQSSRIFSHHLSLVVEEPRCWLERHEEVLNTLAVATPWCFQTCESLSRDG